MSHSSILFIVTGSIAAYKACEVVSQLVQAGHRVRCVATSAALRFVGGATLEGLTGEPVRTDLWQAGAAIEHIALTRWADLVLICPATANTLNRMAAGLSDDLPGALFLARDRTKPWLAAPAMNPAMWSHPATVGAVERLGEWGMQFLQVGNGRTACGEEGEGRLADPDAIVFAVERALARPARRCRVLITSGGTSESLDGVRVLTNTSSGRTGAKLAEHFSRAGHEVVLLRARSAAACAHVREEIFSSFGELDRALTVQLGESFDAVVHAAAVGDFSVQSINVGGVDLAPGRKIESRTPVVVGLMPNPKLVSSLRARSRNPALKVVAFKLTDRAAAGDVTAAVDTLFTESGVDFVVHNDIGQRAHLPDAFPATIHTRSNTPPVACATRTELARRLETLVTS